MFGFLKSPAREGRQLSKDARVIVGMEREGSGMERLSDIATMVEEEIADKKPRVDSNPANLKVVLYELKRANGAARRTNQRRFTALTLTMIYMKALGIGDNGRDAIATIDAFIKHPGVDTDRIDA